MADRKVINLEDLYEVKAVDKDGNYFDRGTPLQSARAPLPAPCLVLLLLAD